MDKAAQIILILVVALVIAASLGSLMYALYKSLNIIAGADGKQVSCEFKIPSVKGGPVDDVNK